MTTTPESFAMLGEVFWKSGVLLGAALCLNLLLRRRSADMRRLVLSAAIAALFAAAVTRPMLPRWAATPAWLPAPPVAVQPAAAAPRSMPMAAGGVSFATPSTTWFSIQPLGAVPLIWLLGASLLTVRYAISLRGLRRLRRASEPVKDVWLRAYLQNAMGRLGGVRVRNVQILQNHSIAAPVTWGVLRPIILLPADAELLGTEFLDAVLCHELAHIQGYDFFLRGLAEAARALIWFQPLIWMVRRQLREEQELACDDRVLAAGGKPSAYARLLLEWDERPGLGALSAVGMGHRSCLKRRLYALLNADLRRNRVARNGVYGLWLAALAAALPLAALDLTPAAKHVDLRERSLLVTLPNKTSRQVRIRVPVQMAQARPAPAPRPAGIQTVSAPVARFEGRTSMVTVEFTFPHPDGRPLTKEDFTVSEDGVPQAISDFEVRPGSSVKGGAFDSCSISYYTSNSGGGLYRGVFLRRKGDAKPFLGYTYTPSPAAHFDAGVSGAQNAAGGLKTTPPVVLTKLDPEYSEQARRAKYTGTVVLMVDVDATGHVGHAAVVRSLGMGLDEKAIEAVKQWKFRPSMDDGRPVASQAQVEMVFQLL